MFGRPSKRKIHLDIPYYSQWESSELVDKFIDRELSPVCDPEWKNSGAVSEAEYELWSWNTCGMACLKMILKSKFGKEYRVIDLAKSVQKYGGYEDDLDYKNNKGLIYYPFCKYIRETFHINCEFWRFLTTNKIKREIEKGNYVIASVNSQIRTNSKDFIPAFKGGHLVLMTGYDLDKNELSFHNPSGYFNKTQQNHKVSEDFFKKYFSGRGIIIQK